MKIVHMIIGFVFLFLLSNNSYSMFFYTASPISGVITDSATGQPVARAVVVAKWFSVRPGYHNPNLERFEVQETLTDDQGKYIIPGFKLKFIPRIFAYIPANQIYILVYKYGYLSEEANNNRSEFPNFIIHQFTGTPEKKAEAMNSFINLIPDPTRDCEWKKTTNLLLEIDKQVEEIERYYASHSGVNNELKPWYLKNTSNEKSACPGAAELLTNARKLRLEGMNK